MEVSVHEKTGEAGMFDQGGLRVCFFRPFVLSKPPEIGSRKMTRAVTKNIHVHWFENAVLGK